MKIEMIKGAANPKPNDFMILTISEISNIRSENAKLRDIAERAIDCVTHTDDCRHLIAELDQLKEGGK
ncbi:MAG: hypothetical protein RL078_55 [Bacteroidota bacterium]|jgi:hypothetical protein